MTEDIIITTILVSSYFIALWLEPIAVIMGAMTVFVIIYFLFEFFGE